MCGVCVEQFCQYCRGANSTVSAIAIAVRLCLRLTATLNLQVKVISNSTTLIADAANKEDISMRVKQIKKELSETDSVYDTEKLSERIAKLAGGVAVIKVLLCHTAAVHITESVQSP